MFMTHGPLDPASSLFVGREAELERMGTWLAHANCVGAVLGARQTGKTSLLFKLRHIFQNKYAFAYVDLETIEGASVEECFNYIAEEMVDQLTRVIAETNTSLPSDSRKFLRFLRELSKRTKVVRIAVILDEVGALPLATAIKLAHTIRAIFTNRRVKQEYARYVFILAGATDMLRLTTGRNSPLRNVTESIYLGDLSLSETRQVLVEGFRDRGIDLPLAVGDRLYAWTNGHPYWTQRIAAALIDETSKLTEESVDGVVEQLLQVEDRNLPHVFRALDNGDPQLWATLKLILEGITVPFSRTDATIAELELIGAIKNERGQCVIRNRVYQEAMRRRLIEQGNLCAIKLEYNEMFKPKGAYALIIGVGDYSHSRFASLPATVRDAEAIAAVLTDPNCCGYPPDNVQLLTGKWATADNIRTAFRSLAKATTPESTAFIYFSGHGGRALENGVRRTYLCPREADPEDLPHTAISGDEFSGLLSAIPARKLLVMLDACHAAGSAELKAADGTVVWKVGLPDAYYEVLSRGTGRVVIASSRENQFSYVRPQGDLSLFTHHLVQALRGKAAVRGDGLIHVLDVFHYVNEAVHTDEPGQTPILKVKDLDLNFPIAVAPTQTLEPFKTSEISRNIAAIREQIVRDPISGARALSEYLAAHPEKAAKRVEVDLKRAELERIQHELNLFGPDPSNQATKNRVVYSLLRICLELEQE